MAAAARQLSGAGVVFSLQGGPSEAGGDGWTPGRDPLCTAPRCPLGPRLASPSWPGASAVRSCHPPRSWLWVICGHLWVALISCCGPRRGKRGYRSGAPHCEWRGSSVTAVLSGPVPERPSLAAGPGRNYLRGGVRRVGPRTLTAKGGGKPGLTRAETTREPGGLGSCPAPA